MGDAVHAAVGRLGDDPAMAPSGRVPGTRELVVVATPYIVVYGIEASAVVTLRVLHAAQRCPLSAARPRGHLLASNPVVLDVVGNDWATAPRKWAGIALETTKTPRSRGFLTVELRGIEPLTSSMPSKRSAN